MLEDSTPFGCQKDSQIVPPIPAAKSGNVDANGDVVDQGPELLTWLTARLRFWIFWSLLPPDEDESGVPA